MKNLAVILALTIICFGCETNETGPLELHQKTIYAPRIDMTYIIPVRGGSGRYDAATDNPEIADVRIGLLDPGVGLMVETRQEGTAVITVTDKRSGEKVECLLTVKAAINRYKIVSVRYAVDAQVPDAIEADLENPPYPIGSTFELLHAVDRMYAGRWIVKTADGVEITSGTFTYQTFPIQEMLLPAYSLLPIEDQIYDSIRFKVDLDGGQTIYDMFSVRGSAPTRLSVMSSHARFYEDLTAYYRTKYPDAGVRTVVRAQLCDYHY